MRVGIVGSREYPRLDQVAAVLDYLDPIAVVIVSGGARGVDRYAERAARERGFEVDVMVAEWDRLGRRAGMVRNAQLVDSVDLLVAFWDGESRGTKNAIEHARHQVKPVIVVTP